jgi:hypothetical protein
VESISLDAGSVLLRPHTRADIDGLRAATRADINELRAATSETVSERYAAARAMPIASWAPRDRRTGSTWASCRANASGSSAASRLLVIPGVRVTGLIGRGPVGCDRHDLTT